MTSAVAQRIFNFSPGPAVLPLPVLQEVQDELLCYPGAGCSILEMSHRDKLFLEVLHGAEANIRSLLGIGDAYSVLFLQGGARLQFSMIAANLLRGSGRTAEYLVTGSWSKYAIEEAEKEGNVKVAFDGAAGKYSGLPSEEDYQPSSDAAYLYYCSNETIQGVQFASEPWCPTGVPLVCDASSDFLCRPVDVQQHGLLYACAQKNAGPAGVTVVIIRRDLLDRAESDLPGYLLYKNHADNDSEWNTPPTFAIYVLGKIVKWIANDIGGLEAMKKHNERKAAILYDVLDANPEFYQGHAVRESRSLMNVTFRLPSDELQSAFLKGASAMDLGNLAGHRSVGGIRASIYNAMPIEGAETLASYMKDFVAKNG